MRLLILGNQNAREKFIKASEADASPLFRNILATMGVGILSTNEHFFEYVSGAGRFNADALYPLLKDKRYDAIVRLHSNEDSKFPEVLDQLPQKFVAEERPVVVDFNVASAINDLFASISAAQNIKMKALSDLAESDRQLLKGYEHDEQLTKNHRAAAAALAGMKESPDSSRQRPSFREAQKATNADLINNAGFLSRENRAHSASSQTTSASDDKKTSVPTPRPSTDSDEGL